MEANDLLTLGLGLTAPWRVVDQSLDLSKQPSELRLEVEAARGERYPCPACGKAVNQALLTPLEFSVMVYSTGG